MNHIDFKSIQLKSELEIDSVKYQVVISTTKDENHHGTGVKHSISLGHGEGENMVVMERVDRGGVMQMNGRAVGLEEDQIGEYAMEWVDTVVDAVLGPEEDDMSDEEDEMSDEEDEMSDEEDEMSDEVEDNLEPEHKKLKLEIDDTDNDNSTGFNAENIPSEGESSKDGKLTVDKSEKGELKNDKMENFLMKQKIHKLKQCMKEHFINKSEIDVNKQEPNHNMKNTNKDNEELVNNLDTEQISNGDLNQETNTEDLENVLPSVKEEDIQTISDSPNMTILQEDDDHTNDDNPNVIIPEDNDDDLMDPEREQHLHEAAMGEIREAGERLVLQPFQDILQHFFPHLF